MSCDGSEEGLGSSAERVRGREEGKKKKKRGKRERERKKNEVFQVKSRLYSSLGF